MRLLKTQEDIRAAIRKRGREIAAQMTDKEVFLSKEFIRYATNLADFILRKHRLYSLDIVYDEREDAPVAFTDGKKILLNAGNSIARTPKLLERRFKVVMGILFHEVGHKLFMDFNFNRMAIDSITAGKLVGKFSDDPMYEETVKEIKAVAAKPYYAPALASIYHNLGNTINDGHDEKAMKRCFPGFVAECITVAGEVQMEQAMTLHDICAMDADAYSVYCSLFLQYAKYGYCKEGDRTPFTEAYLTAMREVEDVIETAVDTDDYAERWDYLNRLMLFLWPVLKKHFPDNPPTSEQNGSGSSDDSGNSNGSGSSNGSGGGSGNSGSQPQGQGGQAPNQNGQQGQNGQQNQSGQQSQPNNGSGTNQNPATDEEIAQQIQQAISALQQAAAQTMPSAPEPVNCSGSAVSAQAVQQGSAPTDNGGLSSLLQSMTEDAATSAVQKELDKAQMEAIRNCNMPLVHEKVKDIVDLHIPPDTQEYMRIAKEVDPIARNLIRDMKALFRELNEEFVQRHKRFGPIIEATESYRPQKDFFAKKKLPEDYPDMALCLLIDQSGSMRGEKIECARQTAILMEKFAAGIGVPIMIAGHSTQRSNVLLNIFTDFTSARAADARYSLGNMNTYGCNRDGYAVRAAAELLVKRPERVKLMISISDGSPNHTTRNGHYSGEEARKDIQQAVKDYRRKGLIIYGAAIDDDKDIIEEIYGKGFLSIDNLSMLPKTLVRLVRQQIV